MMVVSEPASGAGLGPCEEVGCSLVGIITQDSSAVGTIVNFTPQAPAPTSVTRSTSAEGEGSGQRVSSSPSKEKKRSNGGNVPANDLTSAPQSKKWRCEWRWPKKVPSYLWVALAVLVVVEVLAVTGAIFYARSVTREQKRSVEEVARSSARSIETLLDHLVAPMLSLANYVQVVPHYPTLSANFQQFAHAVYKTNPYYQIEICPYGVVTDMALPWLNLTGQALQDFYLGFDLGVDMLDPKRYDFETNVKSIMYNGSVILLGPWYADGELSEGAMVVRYSVFLPPGDWDMPPSHIHLCPPESCTTPDGLVWWGFSNAVFAWKSVKPGLAGLAEHNLLYTLSPDPRAQNQSYLARSDQLPHEEHCEHVRVNVYGWMSWTFCVEPEGGWGPGWRSGLLAGVTGLALLLAVLVGLVLRSRHQAVEYLDRQLELNRQLGEAKEQAEEGARLIAAEKRVMDCLLQRQRDLIALFGKEEELLKLQEGGSEGDEALRRLRRQRSRESVMERERERTRTDMSSESAAIDRIEAVRRQLSVKGSVTKQNSSVGDIKLLEKLGEGTFGKVYRGVWRGTDVAVKAMVLPANMSGAEKREKMAIMEAAISSSLAHPNIVQTYTYFIKTVVEEAGAEECPSAATDGILVGGGPGGSTLARSHSSRSFDEHAAGAPGARTSTARAVHGYEVRLVLEYCDRGCLRDALDGDAFLTPSGVNYRGVLDTAADIAKAMLHLHLADVLHGDLKARNVMLKSSGGEGRGVIGKVADFGLAVKMDGADDQTHMSGMYQGTLTHMAPELLLHGRMSRAADVYAYGITLWELFTGGHVFAGMPRALLGHAITQERRRPAFPPFAPPPFVQLAADCWAHAAEDRPSFETILERLEAMRGELPGPAAPLAPYTVPPPDQPVTVSPSSGVPSPSPGQPPLRRGSGSGTHGAAGLLKLGAGPGVQSGSQGVVANPVFEGGGITIGASGTSSAWDNSSNGGGGMVLNNWSVVGRTNLRMPLAVVEEEASRDLASSKLPSQPTGVVAEVEGIILTTANSAGVAAGARLDGSEGQLPQILE